MILQGTKVLNGPNYWSVQHCQLIQLHLQAPDATPGPAAIQQLKQELSLYFDFTFDIHETPELPIVIAQTAIALQQAFMPLRPFAAAEALKTKGHYKAAFTYTEAHTGVVAAQGAVAIINSIIAGQNPQVEHHLEEVKKTWQQHQWGPSTQSLLDEARRRHIPILYVKGDAYIQLGYGKEQQRISASLTSKSNCIAVDIAGNKEATKQLLSQAHIPTPKGCVIDDLQNLQTAIQDIRFPVVVKPLNANQGKGATTNIQTFSDAQKSFELAQQHSQQVIVEKYISGNDFRVLMVGGKMVAASKRTPASIIGDGRHSIQQLIGFINKHPQRGNGHECALTAIQLDADSLSLLEQKGYTPDTILPAGRELGLKSTANLSTGGTATDVTEAVHPQNITLFERAARVVGLDVCGIDVMAPDLSTPIKQNGGAIIEINAAPGLRMHLQPSNGKSINVAAPIIDNLMGESTGRIPLVAITGTNGKTTTTRLIAHMAQQAGFYTGYTTTDGIYLAGELVEKGDCSGPQSGAFILRDSAVEFAVLECARGGILRSGLCFDECSTAVVTNVAADHLGIDGIDTLEQLARVKSVVACSASKKGYTVLNADDDRVYAMKDSVTAKVALFSLYPNNIRIQQHCEGGGLAAYCDEGYIMLQKGNKILPIEEIKNIPITFGGAAEFNVANVLAASLAAYTNGIKAAAIRKALNSFVPCGETTPGRVNLFHFPHFKVMLDYAHNPHGLRALGKLIASFNASVKVGVIAGVGDRRDEDIIELGAEAARIFDHIIIRHDKDLRGRKTEEFDRLLTTGIRQVDANKQITIVADEDAAVQYMLAHAVPESFITFLCEDITCVYDAVKAYHQSFSNPLRTAS